MCTGMYVGGTALEVYFNALLSNENDNKLLLATIPSFDHNNNDDNMDDEMSTLLIDVCDVRVTTLYLIFVLIVIEFKSEIYQIVH